MSTWGYKNEEQPLHGILPVDSEKPQTFLVGGDVRNIQIFGSSSSEKFLMQEQVRVGIVHDEISMAASIGKIENPRESSAVRWVAPEYFVSWSPKEELHARLGQFEPIYGLNLPDHDLWIKSTLGRVPWNEKNTMEFIFEGENRFVSISGFQSVSSNSEGLQKTGYVASVSQVFRERIRVGVNFLNAEGQGLRERAFGIHAIAGLSEKVYSLFEVDRVLRPQESDSIGFLRIGWEFSKGFSPFLQLQTRAQKNQSIPAVGFQWLPRPHFEIFGRMQRNATEDPEALLMLHYYL